MTRWLVYDPYLASAGGGERYMFAFADALHGLGHEAAIAGPAPDLDVLQRVGFSSAAPVEAMSRPSFIVRSRRYDATVQLANHPPLPSLSRRSVVVVQFPFTARHANPLRRAVEERGLRRSTFVVYSEFARAWLGRRWGVDGVVVPPPVVLGAFEPSAKQRLILNVGRFFTSQHSKRQDALVDAFASLPAPARAGWRLVLAGGVGDDAAARAYVDDVRAKARGLDVEVVPNASADALARLYAQASIYWHATGLDRSDDEPEKAEHFGMSTVEAMSYGAVPVVIDDGGQPEIVDASCGALWRTREELVDTTLALMTDSARMAELARTAVVRAQAFDRDAFRARVRALLDRVAA